MATASATLAAWVPRSNHFSCIEMCAVVTDLSNLSICLSVTACGNSTLPAALYRVLLMPLRTPVTAETRQNKPSVALSP